MSGEPRVPVWDRPHQGHHWRDLMGSRKDPNHAKLRFAEFRHGLKTWDQVLNHPNNTKRKKKQ